MYEYTQADLEKVISGYFTSTEPLRLREFPAKQKRQFIALEVISKVFEKEREYTEKEVNDILSDIHADYVSLRRALIDYQLMERKTDCSKYWVKKR